jgi:hypothetical protein
MLPSAKKLLSPLVLDNYAPIIMTVAITPIVRNLFISSTILIIIKIISNRYLFFIQIYVT